MWGVCVCVCVCVCVFVQLEVSGECVRQRPGRVRVHNWSKLC